MRAIRVESHLDMCAFTACFYYACPNAHFVGIFTNGIWARVGTTNFHSKVDSLGCFFGLWPWMMLESSNRIASEAKTQEEMELGAWQMPRQVPPVLREIRVHPCIPTPTLALALLDSRGQEERIKH